MPIQKITSGIIQDGAIVAADIASVNGSVITANTIANSAIQTGAVENYMNAAGLGFGMRNRIINGAMVIDQRNAGATTTGNVYTLDRWENYSDVGSTYTIQQVADAPTGFINSLKLSVTTGNTVAAAEQAVISQKIEGFNVSDLYFGSASAQTITLSFWVKASLTGTYTGNLQNSTPNRALVFTYSISVANTWEYKTVTIAGDTSGTWGTGNGTGIGVFFCLGCGSNFQGTANTWGATINRTVSGAVQPHGTTGATWQVTGVQLEKGSTATSFDYRPYGTEESLCQRYYQHYVFATGGIPPCSGVWRSSTRLDANSMLPVVMRATPTIATTNLGNIQVYDGGSSRAATAIADNGSRTSVVGLIIQVASGGTEGRGGYLQATSATAGYTLSSEL